MVEIDIMTIVKHLELMMSPNFEFYGNHEALILKTPHVSRL